MGTSRERRRGILSVVHNLPQRSDRFEIEICNVFDSRTFTSRARLVAKSLLLVMSGNNLTIR
jgi:hypothetical protein